MSVIRVALVFFSCILSVGFRVLAVGDEPQPSNAETAASNSNVSKDLNEWQERHAMLVLSTVKVISIFSLKFDSLHVQNILLFACFVPLEFQQKIGS